MNILKKIKNFFVDKASIKVTKDEVFVFHFHWSMKKNDYSFSWKDVKSISVKQIEPAIVELNFLMHNGQNRFFHEEMDGWINFIGELKNKFESFNWNLFEEAKSHINKSYLCWEE